MEEEIGKGGWKTKGTGQQDDQRWKEKTITPSTAEPILLAIGPKQLYTLAPFVGPRDKAHNF